MAVYIFNCGSEMKLKVNSMRCLIVIGLFLIWTSSVLATETPEKLLATLKCKTFVELGTKLKHEPIIEDRSILSAASEYIDRFAKDIDVKNVNKTPKEEEVQKIFGNDGHFLIVKRVFEHCYINQDHLFKQAVHITTSNMR